MKVINNGNDTYESHRLDFVTCPHCNEFSESDVWDKHRKLIILNPRCYKAGCVSTISECPKCFKTSWVHERIDLLEYIDDLTESAKSRITKHIIQLKLNAARTWAKSLCCKCKHLTEIKIGFNDYRSCKRGWGPTHTECDSFEKLPD
jgi:hypothetical protein